MATDLETRKSSSKSEAYLRRKFADLGTRIQRVDIAAHLLGIVLTLLGYAVAVGVFDWFVGNSTTANVIAGRWTAFIGFLGLVAFLFVQTVRCFFRRVNPYYVAHRLEETLLDAKNGLINWLDLHDEELPSAFQKNLSSRAADQWQEGDADQIVKKRKNWVLLGVLSLPTLGLVVLLVLFGPAMFLQSMAHAFAPFYTPPTPILRTQLTLLEPKNGDVEVNPTQTVSFAARIEGRVPIGNRTDAPKLRWRYQDNEDFFTQSLQQDSAGVWTAEMPPGQFRAGFTYKITAGDAETPEHQVSVRAGAHVKKFEITYRHRPYRKLANATETFPNPNAARPHIAGPRGSEVEMLVRTSRPMKSAAVEFMAKNVKKNLPIEMSKTDPHVLICRWMLAEQGQFRIVYTANDGEENADRELYDVDVLDDELPKVKLTRPDKDIELPANAAFLVEGSATSTFGVRSLTLHLRVIEGPDKGLKLAPLPYRADKSFQFDDGSFPGTIEYMDFVSLDQLKKEGGGTHQSPAGTVIEYWLETPDGADYPTPAGNIGRSITYKAKLLAPDPKANNEFLQKILGNKKRDHQQRQDKQMAKQNQRPKDNNPGNKEREKGGNSGGGKQNTEQAMNQLKKENDETRKKVDDATKPNPGQNGDKGADPKSGDAKEKPENSPDAPEPKQKGDQQPMSKGDAGNNKDQGDGKGDSGASKDGGAKNPKADDRQEQGAAKGQDQNGPQTPNKDQQTAKGDEPPNLQTKAGKMNDPAGEKSEPKVGPPDPTKGPGQPRGDQPKEDPREPSFDRIAKNIENLQNKGPEAEAAAQDLKDIAKNADDPRKRDIAREALAANKFDPKTGKKMPNPTGTFGKSSGISDELKAAAANREFAARIGQMQLDDWKNRITPDLLKKAGLTQDDWQRFIKNTQSYDALVRQLNAEIARKALKELNGPRSAVGARLQVIENTGTSNEAGAGKVLPPPELRDAVKRFTSPNP